MNKQAIAYVDIYKEEIFDSLTKIAEGGGEQHEQRSREGTE